MTYERNRSYWFQPYRGLGRNIEFAKVGRKFAFTSCDRPLKVEMASGLIVEGCYGGGRIYESEAVFMAEELRRSLWESLRKVVRDLPYRTDASIEQIQTALQNLKALCPTI